VVFLVGALIATTLRAAESPQPAVDGGIRIAANALIEQLGSPKFDEREQAAAALTELGLAAHQPLVAALKHPDAQVRRQARWILDGVFELDYQRRIKAFEADTGDKQDHNIPGWQRFKKVVGSDATARELFLLMHRSEPGLLESAAAGAEAASEAIQMRLRQIFQVVNRGVPAGRTRQLPSLGTSAALLFVLSDGELNLPQTVTDNHQVLNVIQQGEFAVALKEKKNPAIKRVVGLWMLRPTSINMLQNKLNMAIQYEIDEGVDLALQAAKSQQMAHGHFRAMAISAIGILGGKPYMPALDELLAERTEIFKGMVNNRQQSCEVRDVALAWLVHLSGQDFAAYGLESASREFDNMQKNRRLYLNYQAMGYPDAEKREEALKKWRDYVAANPLPVMPTRTVVEVTNPPVAQRNPAAKADGDTGELELGIKLDLADRLMVQNLNMARELCAAQRYAEGVRLLDDILSADQDYAFQPTSRVPLFRCLKAEAERILVDLPPDGRAAYRLQFEVLARTSLSEALKTGGIDAIAAVADRFFHTEAGAEAAYLIAHSYLDRDEPFRAALHFQRLRTQSRDAARFEPALSLKWAMCCLRAGLAREAEGVVGELAAREGKRPLDVAGEPHAWFAQTREGVRWLESLAGLAAGGELPRGWLMYRGDSTRNVDSQVESPYLKGEPLARVVIASALREQVEKIRADFNEQYRAALPRLYPLVVGNQILLRTATHLQAFDFATGKLMWEAGLEDSLRYYIQAKGDEAESLRTDTVAEGLKQRFWSDLTFGTLSSNGRSVFGVEDIPFGFGAEYQRMAVGPDGQRRLDAESMRQTNLLTAYDLQTGKLQWEMGGAAGTGIPLAGARFLGPPLPLGGRLYVCAEADKETRLYEIDAESGAVVSSLTLALTAPSTSTDVAAMLFPMAVPANALTRRTTASPSYADGILVCQIGENQFVGINLATRSVRWVYQLPEPESRGVGARMFNPVMRLAQLAAVERGDAWADGSVTIAEGRVLLTPMESEELICLSLTDGRFEWSAPRRDGLYVGGARDGRVLVVGRGSVRALDLTSGAPLWPHDRLALPAGSLPSGHGLMAGGRYHLPLSSGEVATLDVRTGRFIAHSRAPDGLVPGNLIAAHGAILSQSAEGLWLFESLAAREAALKTELQTHRGDANLYRETGEVLLSSGRIAEAIDPLRKALALDGDDGTRQLLADAVAEGLTADFARFRPIARELDAVLQQAPRRGDLLRVLARGLLDAGERVEAFEAYLSMLDGQKEPDRLDRIETAREVRRDRWLAARMGEVWQGSEGAARTAIDALIDARRKDDALGPFLVTFGWHPTAEQARLKRAEQLAAQGAALEAEQLLWHVIELGSEPRQREALARLAALLLSKQRVDEATRCYALLAGDLADEVCLEGRTGAQLVAALPADSAVRQRLASPPAWPRGKVTQQQNATPANVGNQRFRIPILGEGGQMGETLVGDIDVNQRRVIARDSMGRERWQLPFAADQDMNFIHNYQYSYAQVWQRGHLAVAWLGNRLYAYDVSEGIGRQLWRQDTLKSLAGQPMNIIVRQRGMVVGLPGAEALPLVSAQGCVCFIQDRSLLAFDPLDGKPLWRRDDVAVGSSLFGDGELLFVTAADAEEAVVFSAVDGSELGRRAVPKTAHRVVTLGRRVVAWRSMGDKMELIVVDPWTEQVQWRRDFDAKTLPALVDNDEIAVMDDHGHFVVLDLASGAERLAADVEPIAGLDRVYVQRSREQYLLAAGRTASGNAVFFRPMQNMFRFSGHVFAFDRAAGKLKWAAPVEEQGLELDQYADVPLMVFFSQVQQLENNQFRMVTRLLVLDKRNGKLLHENESKDNRSGVFELNVDPDAWKVDVRSHLGAATFTFQQEPAAKAGAAASP
jgi:outer membrane protein assembly factor BamB